MVFVLRARDGSLSTSEIEVGDARCIRRGLRLRGRRKRLFPELGINISVVQPGQPLCLYHEENAHEDFLVLAGSCLLIANGEERPLQAWDFVHSPAGTEHVIVGAGVAPSIVLSVGRRQDTPEDGRIRYPVSELAAKYGASAHKDTTDPTRHGRSEHPQPGSTRVLGSTAVGITARVRLRASSRTMPSELRPRCASLPGRSRVRCRPGLRS